MCEVLLTFHSCYYHNEIIGEGRKETKGTALSIMVRVHVCFMESEVSIILLDSNCDK